LRRLGLLVIACLAAAPAHGEEGLPLDAFFRGAVTLDRKAVTIRYDFTSPQQAKDWVEGTPFPLPPHSDQGLAPVEGGLEIRGNDGVRHVAEWKGDVSVTCTLRSDRNRDFGAFLTPGTGEHDFATFTFGEHYFHRWDNQPGGQHSIIKFGDQYRRGGRADDIGFRYVVRRTPPRSLPDAPTVTFTFGQKGANLLLTSDDLELKGRDPGQRLRASAPGFYVIEGRIVVASVTITGQLDPKWLEDNGVDLRIGTAPAGD
jgi:hypothetical protein